MSVPSAVAMMVETAILARGDRRLQTRATETVLPASENSPPHEAEATRRIC
jgi:hypothetical protein